MVVFGASVFGGRVSVGSLADGLIGFWTLNDGSGTGIARDSSVYHNDASLVAVDEEDWNVSPISGYNLNLNTLPSVDGLDEYLDISDSESLLNTAEGSISFWMNMPAADLNGGDGPGGTLDGHNHNIIGFGNSANGNNYIFFLKSSSDIFNFRYRSNSTHDQIRITNGADVDSFADTWKHVVLVWKDDDGEQSYGRNVFCMLTGHLWGRAGGLYQEVFQTLIQQKLTKPLSVLMHRVHQTKNLLVNSMRFVYTTGRSQQVR